MHDLNLSLLREKFVIHDPKSAGSGSARPVVALSNRIVLELRNKKDMMVERFVIRAQNMHSCARLTSRMLNSFNQSGPLLSRAKSTDWDGMWRSIVNDYEFAFNPSRWAAVYYNGKPVFQAGEHHPLLDLIEKCAAEHKGEYEDSIPIAEDAFKKTGKVIKIEYDGNVALAVNLDKDHGRCGIILRGANRTTTFNFSAATRKKETLNYAQCINAAAAFLEGLQLAFMVGMNTEKIRLGIIERLSKQEKQNREAKKRLTRLNAEITNFEDAFDVRYRPEKPEFLQVAMDAEKLARTILEPPEGGEYID